MKILYALQATGNGHISRANELLPKLSEIYDIDILLSGTQSELGLNYFVKYRRKGLSFSYGKKGGIDLLKTVNDLKTKQFLQEVKSIPVENYDLVLNDFEPLSAFACKDKNVPCFAISHQYAVISKDAPKPAKYDPIAWLVLRHYAPAKAGIGFHFQNYNSNILGPIIRSEIRNAMVKNLGHYTVYLPAYSDKKIINILSNYKNINWHIFSKGSKKSYSEGNCLVRPINNYEFVSSFISAEGIICSAGFETPSEALFMGKKLLVIPIKGQYEQHCNATALKEIGVPVLKKFSLKREKEIDSWIKCNHKIHIDFEDNVPIVIEKLKEFILELNNENKQLAPVQKIGVKLEKYA